MPRMHDDVVCVSPRVCRSPARFSLKPRVWERTLVPVFTSVCHRFVVGLCAHRNREKTTQDCRPGRIQTYHTVPQKRGTSLPLFLICFHTSMHGAVQYEPRRERKKLPAKRSVPGPGTCSRAAVFPRATLGFDLFISYPRGGPPRHTTNHLRYLSTEAELGHLTQVGIGR